MINLLPEPKRIRDDNGYTKSFKNFLLLTESNVDYLQRNSNLTSLES